MLGEPSVTQRCGAAVSGELGGHVAHRGYHSQGVAMPSEKICKPLRGSDQGSDVTAFAF